MSIHERYAVPLLIVGIPILFLIVVGMIAYVPSIYAQPQYDMLYSRSESYYPIDGMGNYYVAQQHVQALVDPTSARVIVNQKNPNDAGQQRMRSIATTQLYRFESATGRSEQIDFADAQKLLVDPSPVSPDGYSLEQDQATSGVFPFFFIDNAHQGYVLKKGLVRKDISIGMGEYAHFIGWVLK